MTHPSDPQDPFKFRPHGPWVVLETGEVVSYYDDRGNVEVAIQDQFSPAIDAFFGMPVGVTTLAVETAIDDLTISVADASSASVGDRVLLIEVDPDPAPGQFYLGTILGIAVNDITLDTPINFAYEIGTICAFRNSEIAVDGSITTQIFDFPVSAGVTSLDITRFMFTMECDGAPDDSKFGNLPALTNGIVMRKQGITDIQNFWNIKTNGDFAALSYDVTYSDKAGAGNHGVRCRMSYGGQDKHGVTIRLAPTESLELLVQDDLSGLVRFIIAVQGHVVE